MDTIAGVATILVVDDEPQIVHLVRDYLEDAGFTVTTASDGPTALRGARTGRPDLIVLDLALPGVDGLDVARSLRRESAVPIIMLTARGDESDKLVGLELADSGIYTYGVFRLFQGLWDLNHKFVEMTQQYPSLGTASNPYDIGHWPWGLVVPIVVRAALLWVLVLSFSGMGVVKLDHSRRKAAKAEAAAQAQAA